MVSNFTLDDRYAGVFLTKTRNVINEIIDISVIVPLSFCIYESHDMTLAIGVGDRHTEPVLTWLKSMHDKFEGSSFIASLLPSKVKLPPLEECYVFRSFLNTISEKTFEAILTSNTYFCFIEPLTRHFYVITTSFAGNDFSHNYPEMGTPRTGFKLKANWIAGKSTKRSSERYDPIKSQIKEVTNSSSVALFELLAELKKLWIQKLGFPAPMEITWTESILTKALEHFKGKSLNQTLDAENNILFLKNIDVFAYWMGIITRQTSSLISKLKDYQEVKDPWSSDTSYSTIMNIMILESANRYLKDLTLRADIKDRVSFIPFFGGGFFSCRSVLPNLGPLGEQMEKGETETRIITIPRQFKNRLGALPILAHEVGHKVIDHEKVIDNPILKLVGESISKKDFSNLGETLSSLFREALPQRKESERDLLQYQDLLQYHMQLSETLQIISSYASEILSDLIAISLTGPAYLYALSRFATGTLHEFVGDSMVSDTHPAFRKRILLCLEFLQAIGIIVPYESEYLEKPEGSFPSALVKKILAYVEMPYLLEDHEKAIGRIKSDLLNGRQVSASPVLVLNALWDAVMKKEGYVNEIAVLLSLQQNQSGDNQYGRTNPG